MSEDSRSPGPEVETAMSALHRRLGVVMQSPLPGGGDLAGALREGLASGVLRYAEPDGLAFTSTYFPGAWVVHDPADHSRRHYPSCFFLFALLFDHIYGRKCAPATCRKCFKVKTNAPSLGALMKVGEIQKRYGEYAKFGCQLASPYSQEVWSGVIYADGLEQALSIHGDLRAAIDGDPELGEDVPTSVQRGCTEYEMALGPSDAWLIDESLLPMEQALAACFNAPVTTPAERRVKDAAAMVEMIQTAHQIGDDSYLSLTGGSRVHPRPLDYAARKSADAP